MMPPVWPVYNADGSYNYQGNGYWRIGNDYQHNAVLNPVAMANLQSDVVDRMAIVGKVFAELELYKGALLIIFLLVAIIMVRIMTNIVLRNFLYWDRSIMM